MSESTDAPTRAQNPRGWLAAMVLKICTQFVQGKLPKTELEEGQTLTPHRVAKIVGKRKQSDPPSTGAVTAVFDRWAEFGFATFHDKPKAFEAFTKEGAELGLQGMIDKRNEERKSARAVVRDAAKAEKDAEKAAAKAVKDAERAEAKAQRDAEKAAAKAEKDAAKAAAAQAKAEAKAAEAQAKAEAAAAEAEAAAAAEAPAS